MKKFHSKREKIMEIRQLETFVHVAQLQSFSRAAEVLGYTQSAITVQIRLLENELETRLFDRTGKRGAYSVRKRVYGACKPDLI